MDDTRARAYEDIALDSSRLRSSARLGFASTAAAAAAVTAAAASTVTTTSTSTAAAASSATTVAATCRVARRKRKKRRRQRLGNDDATGAVASRSRDAANATCNNAAVVAETAATNATATTASNTSGSTAAAVVVVLEPDADATTAASSATAVDAAAAAAAAATTAGTDSARVDKPRSRLLVEQHTSSSGDVQLRVGGSGARAAASSVGTTGVTLLNRRAGKRSPRRCNAAGGRRNATTMDLQRLINEVHARPAIWDQKNVNYHNRDVILKMWREIARACEVTSEYMGVARASQLTADDDE